MNERYARQNLIDWFNQEDISNLYVAVVGCGAIGNELIKNLALLGVGKIDIYDFDTIEIHNLTKSVLFREEDVDNPKIDVCIKRAKELEKNISIQGFNGDFWETLSLKVIEKYNIVFSCLDNYESRLRLNKLCKIKRIDFINCGIDSRYASVESFPFSQKAHNCACLECSLPASIYENIRKRYSCGWLKKRAFEEKKIPTTIITSSISAANALSKGLRIKSLEHSQQVFLDTITGRSSIINLKKNLDCPTCREFSNNIEIYQASRDTRKLFSLLKGVTCDIKINFSEPILLETICTKHECKKDNIVKYFECASKYDERLTWCPTCSDNSILANISEEIGLNSLMENFDGFKIPGKFIYFNIEDKTIILEFTE